MPPETIADDHGGRVAGLIERGTEHAPLLRLHAEHGKIVGRDELAEDALRARLEISLIGDVEGNADLECSDSGEQVSLLTVLLDVVMRGRAEIALSGFLHHEHAFGV